MTYDVAFDAVVSACADPSRPGRWITPRVEAAYRRLHELGWAHSVEVWQDDGRLAGGLYGLAMGGLFAGESMFHHATDGSKVALAALAQAWFADGDPRRLVDVQWSTPHLASLGVVEVDRTDYLGRLPAALSVPWTPFGARADHAPRTAVGEERGHLEVTEASHPSQGGTNVPPQVPPA